VVKEAEEEKEEEERNTNALDGSRGRMHRANRSCCIDSIAKVHSSSSLKKEDHHALISIY
jgi:hypothetical protein